MAVADETIIINVETLPTKLPETAHLTRFQQWTRRKQMRLRCRPSDTIASLKKKMAAEQGTMPEMIKKGGTPSGIVLEDTKTLAECGCTESMSIYEFLWEDSKANQENYVEEVEKCLGFVRTHKEALKDAGIDPIEDVHPDHVPFPKGKPPQDLPETPAPKPGPPQKATITEIVEEEEGKKDGVLSDDSFEHVGSGSDSSPDKAPAPATPN